MTRRTNSGDKPAGAVDANGRYVISVARPFAHNGVQFIPSKERTYEVSGSVLSAIIEKVADYRRIA